MVGLLLPFLKNVQITALVVPEEEQPGHGGISNLVVLCRFLIHRARCGLWRVESSSWATKEQLLWAETVQSKR